jgi:hypothetical protein
MMMAVVVVVVTKFIISSFVVGKNVLFVVE